jgi:hypothetical protein
VANQPVMQYYDAAGKRASDPDLATRQFLSDDPARPDASKEERAESGPKPVGNPGPGPAPELKYYDAAGKPTAAPAAGGRQYSLDDPNRPDSTKAKAAAAAPADDETPDSTEATKVDAKAITAPTEDKARKSSAKK